MKRTLERLDDDVCNDDVRNDWLFILFNNNTKSKEKPLKLETLGS